ncbi:hypothetical protein DDE82_008905 [Stemphylium lycopersici]|uniref:Uncharacterized protein n=1 Tax=Stemphylium lycopersici TaxID=183478 RepID=A0A364MSV6_STELY|nr:hypothetical protein TW65_00006 [Stemphylium lycopersici]RAQ98792.1 hypothetical protein DDE82_008905 [Stemphylium lycopersici]RAR01446.1 hypothetical protein DDE83_008905 [Stemphylium lycopersici]
MHALSLSILLVSLLGVAQAISMIDYSPSCDVEPNFAHWYSELLRNNETPNITTEYTRFFAPNGSLVVLGAVSTGAEAILASRRAMLPADGSVVWNHFPNTTVIASESSTEKVYQVSGVLETTTPVDGRCTSTYFQTLFTLEKNETTKAPNLVPQHGGLLIYNGFSINSSTTPCSKGTGLAQY